MKTKLLFTSAFAIFCLMLNINAQTVHYAKKGISQGFENGNAIVADDSGNVYVTGQFEYTSVFDNRTLSSYGSHDIFVAKYNSSGNIVWIKSAGGTDGDIGMGIGIDAQHNVYITGEIEKTVRFSSTISLTSSGGNDIFIAKYDANGNVRWAKKFGDANSSDKGRAIAVAPNGNCYVTGNFSNSMTIGPSTISSDGGNDIFTAKFDSNGNGIWAKRGGGSRQDRGHGIAIDANENVFVTGGMTPPARFHGTTITNSGKYSTFLVKYNSSGSFQWVKAAGDCCDTTEANAIALDGSGNIYLTGSFAAQTKFSSTTLNSTSGSRDVYVAKYNSSGSVQWAKKFGGSGEDVGHGIAVDKINNRVHVTGFVTTAGSISGKAYSFAGYKDVIVASYGTDGSIKWVKTYGGTRRDIGLAVATNSQGFVYTTGLFNGTALFGSFTLVGYPNQPWADFFVTKISSPVNSTPQLSLTGVNDAMFNQSFDRTRNIGETENELGKVIVYPNPTSDDFHFNAASIISFRLYNSYGLLVGFKENVNSEIAFGEELSPGLYFLELYSENEKRTISVVKTE